MVPQLRNCSLVSPPTATPSAWLPLTPLWELLLVDPELLDLSPVSRASGPTMRFVLLFMNLCVQWIHY